MNDINEILNETSGLYNDAQTTLENVLVLRENVSKIVNETLPDVDNKILDNKNKINNHINDKDNPHNVTKEQVGLGNVVNERQYSSENQPPYPVTSVASKTGAVTLEKTDVGLGNVDNTSDLDKPISTATQSALDEKLNTSNVVQTIGTSETDVMSQKAVTEALSNASGLKQGQTKWVTTTNSTSYNIHSLTGSSFFSLNLSTNNGRYTSSATESTYEAGAKTAITFINPSISYTDSSGETKTFSCSHLKSELIYVGETPLVGSSNNAKIISLKGQLVYAIIPSVGNYKDDIRIDFLFKRLNTSSSYQISNIKAIVNHTDAIYNAETSSFTYVSTSEDVSTSIKIMSQRLEVVQYYLY